MNLIQSILNLLSRMFGQKNSSVTNPPSSNSGISKPTKPVEKPALPKKTKYKLSDASSTKLKTVKPDLQKVVKRAITITPFDFSVGEGKRSIARQRQLVASGASQTMQSKHLTGDAVDLFAYIGGGVSWDVEKYYVHIATAMAKAAKIEGVAIKWGAAWTEGDIRQYADDPDAGNVIMNRYAAKRRAQGRKPFIDAVHFELI